MEKKAQSTINTNTYVETIENKEGGVIHIGDKHKTPKQLSSKLGKSTIIGRKKELQEIDQQLNSSNSLLLINGIGGVGKSNIASFYLHSHKEQFDYYGFFEGLDSFIVELREPLDLKAEKPQEAFLEALSKLRKLEGDKLLVLDDVKDIEEKRDRIDMILGLKDSGYKILFTSREDIENIKPYYLDVLSLDDAKALFNSIYPVEDEALLEEILGYLDCHAFFVEKTAHSIKRNLTAQMLKEKFENGEFAQISVKRKQSFDKFLNQLFSLDGLDDEEVLMLKQFSALPSIEIGFEFLETVFQKKGDIEFEELLDYLCEKGWLSKLEGGYKLHQIIKEYLLAKHQPTFEEIEVVVDSFAKIMGNGVDAKEAVDNRENIVYFESLATLLDRLEIENEKVGAFFNNFGLIFYHLGLYQKAEPLYIKALKIIESKEKYQYMTSSYNNLAGFYKSMGEYQKAELFYLNALKIREKILGENHLDTATSYNNLAGLYWSMGVYQQTESLYLKALKIREEILGEEHHDTASSYNDLATLYHFMSEYQVAESLYLKALNIKQKVLGEEHPSTATSYHNLAGLYKVKREYQKAEPLYIKALKIWEKVLGEEHPDTATGYHNLGSFYYGQGEFEKAYEFMKRAVEIWSKVLPSNHPNLIGAKEGLEIIEQKLSR